MAQQPKKRNVAVLSYFSLHEKLGKTNRELKECKKEITEYSEALDVMKSKYYSLKSSSIGTISKLQIALTTSVIINIALLMFTLTK